MRKMIRACMPSRRWLLPGALLLAMLPVLAAANSQLALDKGCLNCHGDPPRRGVPSLAQLPGDYARYQGQNDAARRLARKLREGAFFGHIAAHERLSAEDAESLVQWLIDGAR
jgi:cytochrome c